MNRGCKVTPEIWKKCRNLDEPICGKQPGISHPENGRQRRDGIPEVLQPDVLVVAVLVVVEVHDAANRSAGIPSAWMKKSIGTVPPIVRARIGGSPHACSSVRMTACDSGSVISVR